MRGRREMIARHLERVHGRALSPDERRTAIRKSFDSYARYWMESFRVPYMSKADLAERVTVEGYEHAEAAFAKGNGVIMVAPHIGNWGRAGNVGVANGRGAAADRHLRRRRSPSPRGHSSADPRRAHRPSARRRGSGHATHRL